MMRWLSKDAPIGQLTASKTFQGSFVRGLRSLRRRHVETRKMVVREGESLASTDDDTFRLELVSAQEVDESEIWRQTVMPP